METKERNIVIQQEEYGRLIIGARDCDILMNALFSDSGSKLSYDGKRILFELDHTLISAMFPGMYGRRLKELQRSTEED